MPNGDPRRGPKFDYKMRWFEKLIEHTAGLLDPKLPVMLVGDFNVLPIERCVQAGAVVTPRAKAGDMTAPATVAEPNITRGRRAPSRHGRAIRGASAPSS